MKALFLTFTALLAFLLPLRAQEPVDVLLSVVTGEAPDPALDGQLLNVTCNDYVRCAFLLHRERGGATSLTLLNAASLQRRPLTLPDGLPAGSPLDFHFCFRAADSSCVVRTGADSCRFDGVLLDQRNIVFNPLPGDWENLQLRALTVSREKPSGTSRAVVALVAAILLADLSVFAALHVRRRRARSAGRSEEPVVISSRRYAATGPSGRSGIYLFGGFRVLAADGSDVTARFSPILKELLLLLACHTPQGGISWEQMRMILWFDKDEKSALNNRSVSFFKLRALLRDVGNFDILNNQGRWTLEAAPALVDYYRFVELARAGVLTRSQVEELLSIVGPGPLLVGFDELWADPLKAEVTDSILTVLTHFAFGLEIRGHEELLLDVCDAIAKFDPLNETALAVRCKVYREKGNNILSRQVFASFQKEYQAVYGEPFSREYSEIISG